MNLFKAALCVKEGRRFYYEGGAMKKLFFCIFTVVVLTSLCSPSQGACDCDGEIEEPSGRALLWLMVRSPGTVFRLEMIDMKIDLETRSLIYLDNLEDAYFRVLEQRKNKIDEFGTSEEKYFCLEDDAVDYIYHSIKAQIKDEDGSTLHMDSLEKADQAFNSEWYTYIEDNDERRKLNASAKEYAKEYITLNIANDENEYAQYVDDLKNMPHDQMMSKYYLKQLCSETPLVEMMDDYLVDSRIKSVLEGM